MNLVVRDTSTSMCRRTPEAASDGFVGGDIRRVTPVPIPNTVVKPAEPMILRQRESRSLPAFIMKPRSTQWIGAFFIAPASARSLMFRRPYDQEPAGWRVYRCLARQRTKYWLF